MRVDATGGKPVQFDSAGGVADVETGLRPALIRRQAISKDLRKSPRETKRSTV
jgi:hypothetical protein